LVLTTITSLHFILLIDEPEAFLHPPQASMPAALGRNG
jgi:predicted ATP-dependent endonuclease of OLD family